MARTIGDVERNEMRIVDPIGGDEIMFYYRTPTTEEFVNYSKNHLQRKGKKVVSRVTEARLKYGLEIVTGFRDGDFLKPGPGNKGVPFSADPQSANYEPKWKALLKQYAADLLMALAQQVFEGAYKAPDIGTEEPEESEGEEGDGKSGGGDEEDEEPKELSDEVADPND